MLFTLENLESDRWVSENVLEDRLNMGLCDFVVCVLFSKEHLKMRVKWNWM